MPMLDFIVDDGEYAYEGVANYLVRKGCKGDTETPGVADAVEDVTVMRVDARGIVGKQIYWFPALGIYDSLAWRGAMKRSRLLMDRLEELCQEDLERGSDDN